MKIRCKVCGEFLYPDDVTLALMTDGYLTSGDVNTCDEFWDMLNLPPNDLMDMYSDADTGL
jgi:hypothetical protein